MTVEAILNTVDTCIRATQTEFTNNIYVTSALTDRLLNKRKSKPGIPIQIPHKKSKSGTADWADGGDTFVYAQSDTIFAPALGWSYIRNTDFVKAEDLEQCRGEAEVVDIMAVALEGLLDDVRDKFSSDIFTGTGLEAPAKVTGLETVCHASNEYAKIDRSTAAYAEWRSSRYDASTWGTGGQLSKGRLDAMIDAVTLNGKRPDLIVTTKYVNSTCVNSWATPRQMFVAKTNPQIGFEGFTYRGIPVVIDEKLAAGEMYVLNTDYWNVYTPTAEQMFKIERFSDESEFAGVRMRVRQTLQLVCREPKLQTRAYSITDVV